MRIYTYQPPVHARASSSGAPPVAKGTSWARFGRDVILYSDEGPEEAGARPASRGARLAPRQVDATREQLHVVVQNGRLFQQQCPDVPVLHDRGRFLLVQIDPERARRVHAEGETCYGVTPLSADQVVFEVRDAPAGRARVPFIQALVSTLKREDVQASLEKLVSFDTRHSTSARFGEAVAWARAELDGMRYETQVQDVTVGGGTSRNVIADKPGSPGASRDLAIVTAHLDSVNLQGGPAAPAPGADDNASGSAGLLAIARAFRDHASLHDLRLILFGGEEQGLFGSKHYVATLPASEIRRIKAVVNMDMIGSLHGTARSVLLEGAPVSQAVIDGLSEAAGTYTDLSVESSLNPFASDHVPFITAGIPAVLTIEGADNTNDNVHSARDTLDSIDYDFLVAILRMNVAFVASLLGGTSVPATDLRPLGGQPSP
jgi:hypothetical protein